ncbi:MAG: MFS transporter, partial [Bacilli bacterium]
ALGMATAPFLTVLSTNLLYLTAINLWTGLFVSGIVLLLFNQLLKVSPEDNRTTYLANYNVLLGIIGFLAPQFGVLLLEKLGMLHAMSISSGVRVLGGISFLIVVVYLEKKMKKTDVLPQL